MRGEWRRRGSFPRSHSSRPGISKIIRASTIVDEEEIVRVRFAPSPTGTLHIGGARTALFNWLKV